MKVEVEAIENGYLVRQGDFALFVDDPEKVGKLVARAMVSEELADAYLHAIHYRNFRAIGRG